MCICSVNVLCVYVSVFYGYLVFRFFVLSEYFNVTSTSCTSGTSITALQCTQHTLLYITVFSKHAPSLPLPSLSLSFFRSGGSAVATSPATATAFAHSSPSRHQPRRQPQSCCAILCYYYAITALHCADLSMLCCANVTSLIDCRDSHGGGSLALRPRERRRINCSKHSIDKAAASVLTSASTVLDMNWFTRNPVAPASPEEK